MKIDPNANISNFIAAVQTCRGDVWFTTPEGDELNLKSALSQFVFTAVAAGALKELNGSIRLKDEADRPLIERYLLVE